MPPSFRFGLSLFVGIALAAPRRGDDRPRPLVVCAVPAAMPRTGKAPDGTPRGLDVAVAERLGRSLGRPVEFHWCASPECAWNCLPDGRCDVVLGQPLDSGPPRAVAWSVPYAGARFGLVVPRDAPAVRSLADLRGKRVGIVTGTVALAEKDHAVARFKTPRGAARRVRGRGARRRLPRRRLRRLVPARAPEARALRLVAEYVPRERWNMALAVRAEDAAARWSRSTGRWPSSPSRASSRKIYADYGVPFRPSLHGGTRPPAGRAQHLAPDPRPRRAGRQHGPGQLALLRRQGRPPGIRRRAGPGPGPAARRQAADRLARRPARDRGGRAARARAATSSSARPSTPTPSPTTSRWRGRSSTRGPTTARAICSSAARTDPASRSLAELKGERRSAWDRGRLGRRLPPPPAGLPPPPLPQPARHAQGPRDGDIDFAYLWANVGWTLHVSPDLAPSWRSSRATCPRTTGTSRSP